ncbi:MAG: putative lipase [Saprospiraceae bacterium]|nr:putative lipase [Saprospiraceae bacterium]
MKHILIILLFLLGGISQINAQCSYNITASLLHQDSLASGDFRLYPRLNAPACNINELDKPIIFVETFDFLNEQSAVQTYTLLNQPVSGSNVGAISSLRLLGYDVIILNFDDATNYIQSNAFLLIELINQINNSKISNEELTIIGHGMGGVVARYALAYMEEHNMPRNRTLCFFRCST